MHQAVAAGAQAGLLRGTPFFSTAQRKVIIERARGRNTGRHHLGMPGRDFIGIRK
jgi:hypothetical protein